MALPPPVDRRYTRRTLLRAALGSGGVALAALGGCSLRPGETRRWGGRFLTVATTGGVLRQVLREAICVPFSQATGCRVMDVILPVDELVRELRRQVLIGVPEWDVVGLDLPRLAALNAETPALFDRLTGPADQAAGSTPGDYGATILSDTLALACRSGPLGGRTPTGWPAAWDTDAEGFPGPRAYPRDPVGLLEIALLADGVDPARLYPLDLPRAFGSLDRIFPAIRLWWQQPDRAADALAFGEADLILARGSDLRAAISGGAAAQLAFLPSPVLPLALALPHGTPNGDVARDFIAAALQADAQEALADAGYTPGAAPAASASPEDDTPPLFALDVPWWRDHCAETFARFGAWLNQ